MRLKSIDIRGMNKVIQHTYTLDNDVVYLNGKNGAGKSTVLNAIQLALLGYIPGIAKKNDLIMKHANGPFLSVTATLDDDGKLMQVSRVYTANKKGINCSVSTIPDNLDIADILGGLELPVFNFNEFVGMSANKLKDWFISFLPSNQIDINWDKELKESLQDIHLTESKFYNETIQYINSIAGDGVDQVRAANAYLKQLLSFKKSEMERMTNSIQSLIFYDDYKDDMAIEDIEAQKQAYQLDYTEAITLQKSYEACSKVLEQLATYKDLNDSLEQDDRYKKALDNKTQLESKLNDLSIKLTNNSIHMSDAQSKLHSLISLTSGNGVCPYTNSVCDSIKASVEVWKAQMVELQKEIDNYNQYEKSLHTQIQNTRNEFSKYQMEITSLENQYKSRDNLKSMVNPTLTSINIQEVLDRIQFDEKTISELSDKLVKAKANQQYNSLVDTFTAQKFDIQQSIEALKVWIKLTGENGLQTQFMGDPFADLSENLSGYLSAMFDEPNLKAHFNLSTKVNSFSFGIDRNGSYIPFDMLSSGEKCMYTLALLTCLTDTSNAQLKLIMIDDLFDHLDDENIENVFKGIQSISGIQYIFAGVKPCKAASKVTVNI